MTTKQIPLKRIVKIHEKIKSKFQREFNTMETYNILTSYLPIWWSWGVDMRRYLSFKNSGIIFHVNGNHFTGYVLITLSYNDTYTVTFYNKLLNQVDEITDIYFDELVDRIDTYVEKIPEYNI